MSNDRTILRRGVPKFGINETAYIKISATKGFVEPIKIIRIDFDPASNSYAYTWGRDLGPAARNVPAPFVHLESELVTLCEALDIQIPTLERELAAVVAQFAKLCPNGSGIPYVRIPSTDVNGRTVPPAPRFGYNEVVYLRESAESLGRLEAYKITDFHWDQQIKDWVYSFFITRRPGRTMTVGDRGDMTARSSFNLEYPESQLVTVCEALPMAVEFMTRAVSRAKLRRTTFCNGATDAS